MKRGLWRNAHVATMAGTHGFGLIDSAAIVAEDEAIAWIGRDADLPAGLAVDEEHDVDGALVTPGLVDAHTHLVYGGDRAGEFELRLGGASYEDIARAGGGIRSTVRATRSASDDELFAATRRRAMTLLGEGVTTLEIKSGYGLTAADEARCLRVARRVGDDLRIDVRTTCLAAHTVPPEFAERPDAYVDAVCEWLPALHREGLVDAVDAFCERIAFTAAQTRRVFQCARALGLPVKLHAEQLSDSGGAALAASFDALSCDHLEHLSPEGVAAMAGAGTVAVLLPGAFYFLRETSLPPIQPLRDAGVPIAIATDHNPGTSPVLSPLLMLQMACTLFRLTPEEAWRGMTVNGARALGLAATHGSLATGKRADLVVWDAGHPRELCYWIGGRRARRVFKSGLELSSDE